MREPKMNDISDVWFTITNWDRSVYQTDRIQEAKLALKEGRDVLKTTRKMFESGPAIARLELTIVAKKISDL